MYLGKPVTLDEADYLISIGALKQGETVAGANAQLTHNHALSRLVYAGREIGGIKRLTTEIKSLFFDQGGERVTRALNNLQKCNVVVTSNGWYWIAGDQLLQLYYDDSAYTVQHQGQYYAPIALHGNSTPQLQDMGEVTFTKAGKKYYGAKAQKVVSNICYMNDSGKLVFVDANSYYLNYHLGNKWTQEFIDSSTFDKDCVTDEQSATSDEQYFAGKLEVIFNRTASDFRKMGDVCRLLQDISCGKKEQDLDYIPNIMQRVKNRFNNNYGFTAFDATKTRISGSYRYLDCGTVNDGFFETAHFEVILDGTGAISATTVTTKGSTVLSYVKGLPIKA